MVQLYSGKIMLNTHSNWRWGGGGATYSDILIKTRGHMVHGHITKTILGPIFRRDLEGHGEVSNGNYSSVRLDLGNAGSSSRKEKERFTVK